MASMALLFFWLMMSVSSGNSYMVWLNLNCKPALGEISHTTHIFCSMECLNNFKDPTIITVAIKRSGEKKPCFTYHPHDNETTGDSRFKAVSYSSVQLQNTAISDEGEYIYFIRTKSMSDTSKFTINVTAKYNNPDISSVPEKIEKYGPAELHCTASGGYPAGTIHWFDQSNTNWTKNSVLQTTRNDDGLYTLSSKLSFQSFDPLWAPLKCIVLNNRYQEEGGRTFNLQNLQRKGVELLSMDVSGTRNLTVVVVEVILCVIIIIFLTALWWFQKYMNSLRKAKSIDLPWDFYTHADADEKVAQDDAVNLKSEDA